MARSYHTQALTANWGVIGSGRSPKQTFGKPRVMLCARSFCFWS